MKPRNVLDMFMYYYNEKDQANIDEMMNLFSKREDIEMIGIGATLPGNYEWFIGHQQIKEIIQSDWKNWGKVVFNEETINVYENNDTAWFRLCTKLEQVETKEEVYGFFLTKMKELLNEEGVPSDRMFNASHYGIRRMYERNLGKGHLWDMIITGVMIKEENDWTIHSLHWSMPVE